MIPEVPEWLCRIVEKLHAEVVAAMAEPAVKSRFIEFGAEPLTMTPDELGRFISAEVVKWRGLIAKAGIKLEQ